MKSLCEKCKHCWYSTTLWCVPNSLEEFDPAERWCACGYILKTRHMPQSKPGPLCGEFYKRQHRLTIQRHYDSGHAHYSDHQLRRKDRPGEPYRPRPGDIVQYISDGNMYYRLVAETHNTYISVYQARRGCDERLFRAGLSSSAIIGYFEPEVAPSHPLLVLAEWQQDHGIPPSGLLTADTQVAILYHLAAGDVDSAWPALLAGLGYDATETELFQQYEQLPQTGEVDTETLQRARVYLRPQI